MTTQAPSALPATPMYRLLGADRRPYDSPTPGALGGHARSRLYGRLDCPSALRWLARGHYAAHRVFFADEATARAAGHRPCAVCLPHDHAAWRTGTTSAHIEALVTPGTGEAPSHPDRRDDRRSRPGGPR